MGRKMFTAEQIIFKLREVEVLVGQGIRRCRGRAAHVSLAVDTEN